MILCPRCGSANVSRATDPWGGHTGPYTFDPRDTIHCACCGESDALGSAYGLCAYCASGQCDSCANGGTITSAK